MRRGVLKGDHIGGWRRTGGSGHDCRGPNSGLEHRFDALLRAERGEMRGRHWQTDPTNQSIPPPLQPGAPTGPSGGSDTLLGPGAIVLGDLNDDIQDQNPRRQQVGELLMEFGLVDL